MTEGLHQGDCVEVMAGFEPESVDAVVCDPPYGLEFMGHAWDRLGDIGQTSHAGPRSAPADGQSAFGRVAYSGSSNVKCRACGRWAWTQADKKCVCEKPDFPNLKTHQARLMQDWHGAWAEAAYRIAKPSAYLLAFGGTRTVHRLTVALEDAGWVIRDLLVWGYASGFPKSKASLKPAWEPIVLARKPGPVRDLAIDRCRLPISGEDREKFARGAVAWQQMSIRRTGTSKAAWIFGRYQIQGQEDETGGSLGAHEAGRWPSNIVLTDPIFDGDMPGVVGGGETAPSAAGLQTYRRIERDDSTMRPGKVGSTWQAEGYGDSGTYSRFFLIPKADRGDREPVLGALSGLALEGGELPFDQFNKNVGNAIGMRRRNSHPTVKPVDLMRHLVRLVTPVGGLVIDPFLGSGTTAIAAEMEGFRWAGIEREADYLAIAEARLNGTQRGLGLGA